MNKEKMIEAAIDRRDRKIHNLEKRLILHQDRLNEEFDKVGKEGVAKYDSYASKSKDPREYELDINEGIIAAEAQCAAAIRDTIELDTRVRWADHVDGVESRGPAYFGQYTDFVANIGVIAENFKKDA